MNFSILKTAFSYALRDVSRSRLVFFLTVVSLSILFTAILLTGGILEGFSTSLSKTQTDVIGELVIVPKGEDIGIENVSKMEAQLRRIDNVEAFSIRYPSATTLEYKDKKIGPQFNTGIDVSDERTASVLEKNLKEGRFIKETDDKKIVLGATLADALVGLEYDNKRIPVGEKITLISPSGNRWEYEVVGITETKTFFTNWSVFMTSEELKSFSNSNNVGLVVIKLKDPDRIDETKKEIAENLSFGEVQTWKQQFGFIYDIISVFSLITGSIITLLSIAVFMVTSVILYINFIQYRRQIGILKAMGTSNSFIVIVYMAEAFIFSTLSYGIAFVIFYLMNLDSNNNPIPLLIGDFHTSLELGNIITTFLILAFSSIGGSVIPAFIAAKTNIVDVIRDA